MPRISSLTVALSVTILTSGAAGRTAVGQTVEEHRERIARLRQVWEEADSAADRADSILRNRTELERIQLGTMVVYSRRDLARVVRAGTRLAHTELVEALGPDTTMLNELSFYFPISRLRTSPPVDPGRTTVVVRLALARPDRVRIRLVGKVEEWLSEQADTLFGRWLGWAVPVSADPPDMEEMYEEFATVASPLAEQCRRGDLTACRLALHLIPVDDPITEWYDAEGRRNLLRAFPGIAALDLEAADICIERGWDAVCIALLQLVRKGGIPPPVDYAVRMNLLRFALRRGGDGAYGRLRSRLPSLDDRPAIEDLLAHVADVPIETLIGDWRRAWSAARPPQVTFQLRGAIASMGWIAAVLGLALRNTRWR